MRESAGCTDAAAVPDVGPHRRDAERVGIIRAAHRLIGHRGGSISIEDILREAGVNRRTFYRHFASKDALVLAMLEEAGELVRERLLARVREGIDGREAVVGWIAEFLTIGWDPPRAHEGRTFIAPEVGLVAGIADVTEEVHAGHRRILADALRRARQDGSLPHADPELDAFAIHAVALRVLEMRARGHLGISYDAARKDIARLFFCRR